jgi:hypothetical protein
MFVPTVTVSVKYERKKYIERNAYESIEFCQYDKACWIDAEWHEREREREREKNIVQNEREKYLSMYGDVYSKQVWCSNQEYSDQLIFVVYHEVDCVKQREMHNRLYSVSLPAVAWANLDESS